MNNFCIYHDQIPSQRFYLHWTKESAPGPAQLELQINLLVNGLTITETKSSYLYFVYKTTAQPTLSVMDNTFASAGLPWKHSKPYGEGSFTVTNKATIFEWKGHGLKVHVSDNCIFQNVNTARLDFKVCTFQQLKTVPGASSCIPVSALYSVTVGEGRLCKPVTFEIQHCAESETCASIANDDAYVMLLHAVDSHQDFKAIKGDRFECDSLYGKAVLPELEAEFHNYQDFSWLLIVLKQHFLPGSIRYKAQVYMSTTSTQPITMHFIVTMALDCCTTVGL